jgi:glycosidase
MAADFVLEPHWYKDAIVYETHVKAFHDGNGDGVGDLAGLIDRLDYLEQLGITCLWLLPFYPSPMRDDGYDIADYRGVHPAYGTLEDFRRLVDAAHQRDIAVLVELVVNHTSDQHPWFQRARRAPRGSSERDYYVWSDPTRGTGKPASSSRTRSGRTGPGIRWPARSTGTGSSATSPISTSTTRASSRRSWT